jgi:hypothetical protein
LNDFHIQLPCAVDSTAQAILDPEHRAFVNHEVYYFSSESARQQFEAHPYEFTGKVTDPVSLSRFQPIESSLARLWRAGSSTSSPTTVAARSGSLRVLDSQTGHAA